MPELDQYQEFIRVWKKSECVEEVSNKLNKSKSACSAMAWRIRSLGVDLKKMDTRKSRPIKDRFLSKVLKTKTCWIWTGCKSHKGYGNIQEGPRGGMPLQAHRVAWEIYFGEIPDGLFVLHKCDNRACVRPGHLFLGTAQDNTDDMVRKNRAWWQNKDTMGGPHIPRKKV